MTIGEAHDITLVFPEKSFVVLPGLVCQTAGLDDLPGEDRHPLRAGESLRELVGAVLRGREQEVIVRSRFSRCSSVRERGGYAAHLSEIDLAQLERSDGDLLQDSPDCSRPHRRS